MMITLHVYLPNITYVVTNFLIPAYVKIFVDKVVYGMRVHQNTWGESVTGTKMGSEKRRDSKLS